MDILFSDSHIVVCVKPIGSDAEHDVPSHLKEILGGDIFPVHRLDRTVSGVMVYARTKQSAAALSRAIQDGTMIKEYLAVVHGAPPTSGTWEDLLFKDSRQNKVFVVKRERRGVKKARLSFERLAVAGERSLVRIRLYTGRTHQIRVQFASRGFPLSAITNTGRVTRSKRPCFSRIVSHFRTADKRSPLRQIPLGKRIFCQRRDPLEIP